MVEDNIPQDKIISPFKEEVDLQKENDKLRKKAKLSKIAIALFIMFILIQVGFWYYIYTNTPILTGENACKTCQERLGYVCKPEQFTINLTEGNEDNLSLKYYLELIQNGTQ